MMPFDKKKRAAAIVCAVGLTTVLAILLAARVAAFQRDDGASVGSSAVASPQPSRPPSAAAVPLPEPIVLSELPNPYCWGCSWNQEAPLEFQVDLDLLAPLGTGRANAAHWFRQFAPDGARFAGEGRERYGERKKEISLDGDTWTVLPGDDPLLLEAEPWVDQATCRFYPAVWEVAGWDTPIPDLLMMLDLARAWVVRGKRAEDPDRALEDFRRAIRLGRLLRQDDVTIIQDLVAIACIRVGAEAIYELAREQQDAATMLVTAMVLADKDAMRLQTAGRITAFEWGLQVDDLDSARPSLRMTDDELDSIVELTQGLADRRFRMEGLLTLQFVLHLGTPAQRERAEAALGSLADDSDELLGDFADRIRQASLGEAELRELIERLREQ